MFKRITIAAMAAVSVCAVAQSSTSWPSQDPSSWTLADAQLLVQTRANQSINAGDAYKLSNMLGRSPSTVTSALAFSLARNSWQAHVIAEEMAMARYPTSTGIWTTNADGTSHHEMYAENMRPMRMVMASQGPKEISYATTLDILTSNISTSEATQLQDWWKNRATERERDVIVRFLKANARLSDNLVFYRQD